MSNGRARRIAKCGYTFLALSKVSADKLCTEKQKKQCEKSKECIFGTWDEKYKKNYRQCRRVRIVATKEYDL